MVTNSDSLFVLQAEDQDELAQSFAIHQQSQPFPWSKTIFFDQASTPYEITCISAQGVVVAYMVTLWVVDEVTVMDIAVQQQLRRKGYGNMLFEALLSKAKSRQFESIFLEVRASNKAAIALYEQLQFDILDIRKNYYPHPHDKSKKEDAVIMRLVV